MIFIKMCNTDHNVVSVACQNHLLTCWIDSPVTHIYKNVMSCSSSKMCLELWWPYHCKFSQRWRKTCSWTPSSLQIHSGWPLSSSKTHISPMRADVWYRTFSYRVFPYKTTCSIMRAIKISVRSISSSSVSPESSKALLGVSVCQYSERISLQL